MGLRWVCVGMFFLLRLFAIFCSWRMRHTRRGMLFFVVCLHMQARPCQISSDLAYAVVCFNACERMLPRF